APRRSRAMTPTTVPAIGRRHSPRRHQCLPPRPPFRPARRAGAAPPPPGERPGLTDPLRLATLSPNRKAPMRTKATPKRAKAGGLDVFYREAGPKDTPAVLLLHGFPTSSQMFRNLIPLLADRYRVVAPDYPGFGHSSMPPPEEFAYTFDNLARVIDGFTE